MKEIYYNKICPFETAVFYLLRRQAICIYEGEIEFGTMYDMFALYKDTSEKNLIFVNMLFIEKETGSIYTWRGEEFVQISVLEKVKSEPTSSPVSEIDDDLLLKNMTEDELLDKAMEELQRTGRNNLNLIFDGEIEFLNRSYYVVSTFDDFKDHIIRTQGYYIDCGNGEMYRVGENTEF